MVTKEDAALIKRAMDALTIITAKGYLSDADKKALEQIIHSNERRQSVTLTEGKCEY